MFISFFHFASFYNVVCNSKKQLNETSRKCKSLTAAQKKEICLKKAITPYIKQKELATQYDVSEGMISDILKKRDR